VVATTVGGREPDRGPGASVFDILSGKGWRGLLLAEKGKQGESSMHAREHAKATTYLDLNVEHRKMTLSFLWS